MRDVFHHELDSIAERLLEMTGLAGSAIASSTTALLEADLALAESVIAADVHIDRLQRDLDDRAIELLARQQPVATDLRVVVSSLRMSATLERMGDLARHVSKLARLRFPEHAIPTELEPTFREMGGVAELIALKAGRVISSRDLDVAAEIEVDDDELDRLHRHVFTTLMSGAWDHPVEATVDVTLCSRYYERFGDHAVSLSRRVGFLVTGRWSEHAPTT
ncbi:MAG TPA: phosphate signaling complex protein PhoU [Actinomycetales bacterium]|nr:phosphate signaling complex protein PhoU [Actinomycetales bacterium]